MCTDDVTRAGQYTERFALCLVHFYAAIFKVFRTVALNIAVIQGNVLLMLQVGLKIKGAVENRDSVSN